MYGALCITLLCVYSEPSVTGSEHTQHISVDMHEREVMDARESNLLPSLFVMAYLGHAYMYRPCIRNKAKKFHAGTTGAFTMFCMNCSPGEKQCVDNKPKAAIGMRANAPCTFVSQTQASGQPNLVESRNSFARRYLRQIVQIQSAKVISNSFVYQGRSKYLSARTFLHASQRSLIDFSAQNDTSGSSDSTNITKRVICIKNQDSADSPACIAIGLPPVPQQISSNRQMLTNALPIQRVMQSTP
ncbi:hypothetical protein CI102_8589 [Trichoderma harzianum]|nr:hypothetical protein CI102_8589 [Trichoderma harzianum]